MIPEVINTVKSDFGWDDEYDLDYGEYTLEEAFFNQLEEERFKKSHNPFLSCFHLGFLQF